MSRTRSRVVFLLLILILLVVSALLGLLTWWLGQQDGGASNVLWPADDLAASAFPIVGRMGRWTG
jgi:hypothetical protein